MQILDHNRDNPEDKIKFPTAIDLHKWLVTLVKPEYPWYYEVSFFAPQYALRQLAEAWKRAFKKTSKPPRFKKKGRADSFTLDGSIKLDHFRIKVPKIGWLRTHERLPIFICSQPKSVTISRTADRWFISFRLEVEPVNYPKPHPVVGVDLGIKTLAVLSTGEVFEGAWRSHKIANIRKDILHKLTTYLAKNHSRIGIENLNVSGMMANHKLAKAIQDMGFYEFRRQLEYKCQLYGSTLIVVDRWYPSTKTCSQCHTSKDEMPLSERVFRCDNCGFECDMGDAERIVEFRASRQLGGISLWTG